MSAETDAPSGAERGPEPLQPGKAVGSAAGTLPSADLKRNRADLVLFLGILSLLCCSPVGPLAWIMGASDLKGIREGTVSSGHLGTLKAGWIMGIMGTLLFGLQLVVVGLVAVHLPGSLGDLRGLLGDRLQGFKQNVEKDLKAGPLAPDQLAYAGEWVGNRGTVIKVYPDGTGDCKWRNDNMTSEQVGGRVRIEGDKLSIGFFGLDSAWHIDKQPSRDNGTWTMILDGEVFFKKGSIEGPSPDEKDRRQRPKEYEI